MNILEALAQSQTKEKPSEQHDYITDGVWDATLYRLGFDEQYYKDVPVEEREDFLNRLEKQK